MAIKNNDIIEDKISLLYHELNTPVNLILATSKLSTMRLKSGDITTEEILKYLDNITKNSSKISNMINNILASKTLEVSSFQRIDLNDFAVKFTDGLKPFQSEHNFELILDCNIDSNDIILPVDTLERVLLNLISNAVKYNSKNDKKVWLKIYTDDESAYISVKDNGNGIPEENIPMITEKMYRVPGVWANGLGLGMHIVKEFTVKLNGEIKINSKLKKGTEITLKIPIEQKKRKLMMSELDYQYKPSITTFEIELSSISD